ncbi:hypothetical protein F5Y05DRAFT_413032 [Hypoxylon sp. FL0543]|nr:hypothetical protein F5Y05DRAFT_413032 [Hypoxylon sp. FL0543]
MAAFDGHHAERLAEWTARKDFLEICQQRNWTGPDCETSYGEEIGAPPNFHGTRWKRGVSDTAIAEVNLWHKALYCFVAYVSARETFRRYSYGREALLYKMAINVPLTSHMIWNVLYPPPLHDLQVSIVISVVLLTISTTHGAIMGRCRR